MKALKILAAASALIALTFIGMYVRYRLNANALENAEFKRIADMMHALGAKPEDVLVEPEAFCFGVSIPLDCPISAVFMSELSEADFEAQLRRLSYYAEGVDKFRATFSLSTFHSYGRLKQLQRRASANPNTTINGGTYDPKRDRTRERPLIIMERYPVASFSSFTLNDDPIQKNIILIHITRYQ